MSLGGKGGRGGGRGREIREETREQRGERARLLLRGCHLAPLCSRIRRLSNNYVIMITMLVSPACAGRWPFLLLQLLCYSSRLAPTKEATA